ncbi:MAG: ATP-binding cassette domain-containing protein [Terriglobales bacterium]
MLIDLSSQRVKARAAALEPHAVRLRAVDFSYCTGRANGPLYTGFDLAIQQGSVVALMGASGSGKSTLGKMMGRIIGPTAGRVEWSTEFKKRSDVVYMDQHAMNSIFPWHTVRQNLRYPLEKLRWEEREIEARVSYLASLFRLEALLDTLPANISGGELQRLALARCLSWKPELAVLDEPFSALDRDFKSHIISALQELSSKDGMTLIVITHSVSDALAIATRYVVIGDRPVRVMSDMDFKSPHPRAEGTLDHASMEKILISCIREGLV